MPCRRTAALTFVAFVTACTAPRAVWLDTGAGLPLEYRPPTWNRAVDVNAADFEQSLGQLMLNEPLVIRPTSRGWLVRTSSPRVSDQATTGYWLGKALGGPCRHGQPREQCLSLLDDVMRLRPWEKVAMGLGLSLEPMRESIARGGRRDAIRWSHGGQLPVVGLA